MKLSNGEILHFTKDEMKYFNDFAKDNNCSSDSDDEEIEVETRRFTSPEETIPYLKELGIFEQVLKKEFTREEFDDFLRTRTVRVPVGLNIHVIAMFKNYINLKYSNAYKYLYENNKIPKFENISDDINYNIIEYYKKLNSYLIENDLKEEFINYSRSSFRNEL